ncbi:MAG TPA: hypothetical protein DCL15_24740 [Chloroflexi bacterium]|nr:hypothetical protein [Chloroflexota bacterium]HHW87278.1 hypothetical protein [Chloroflexota bacterium]
MSTDRTFVERNRAATDRLRTLAATHTDAALQQPVGAHWTAAVALVHLAFWDRRVLALLDAADAAGEVVEMPIDLAVNDISLPLWAAIPPRAAAELAIASAETLDRRLEELPTVRLEQLRARNEHWIDRSLHRHPHLDEIEAALQRL